MAEEGEGRGGNFLRERETCVLIGKGRRKKEKFARKEQTRDNEKMEIRKYTSKLPDMGGC